MAAEQTKMKIVKRTLVVAVDEKGETHPISNFPLSTKEEEIMYEEVDGLLNTEWKQDKHSDGSYSRSETEHTSFEITQALKLREYKLP